MKGFKILDEIFKRIVSSVVNIKSNDIFISSEIGSANCRVDANGNVYVGGSVNNAYMKVIYISRSDKIERTAIAEVV